MSVVTDLVTRETVVSPGSAKGNFRSAESVPPERRVVGDGNDSGAPSHGTRLMKQTVFPQNELSRSTRCFSR